MEPRLNIYCQLTVVKKLVPGGGDMVNEVNLFKSLEKFANVYYSGSRFNSTPPHFGTTDYPESIEDRMNKREYDLYYVRSNLKCFAAIPKGKPKIWFSIPYNKSCYDTAAGIASLTPPFTDAIKAGNRFYWVPPKLQGKGYDTAITLHQSVEDSFKPLQDHPKTKAIRKSLGDKFIIGELGKVGPSSYPHAFLSVLPELIKKYDVCYLVASGKTQKNLISDKNATMRHFAHEDMPYVTSACDLIMISTWTVGWHYGGCRRLLQATACGVPVVLGRSLSREEFLGKDYPLFVPFLNKGIESVKKVTPAAIAIDAKNLMNVFDQVIPNKEKRLEVGKYLRGISVPFLTSNYWKVLKETINEVVSNHSRNKTPAS